MNLMEDDMKKTLICTVAAATALLGTTFANAQTADRTRRDVTVTGTIPAFVAHRCNGASCLQAIPSLGVAF